MNPLIIPGLISAGSGLLGGLFGGSKGSSQTTTSTPTFTQLPDYQEATGARESLYGKLNEFGNIPGYGAITPDFQQLFESARKKISDYYRGGAEGDGGLLGQLKSSRASRGVSEQPGTEAQMLRLGAKEGEAIADTAVQQATQQANMSEQARRNWISDMFGLAQLKPSYATGGMTTTTGEPGSSGLGGLIANIGSGISDVMMQGNYQNFLKDLLSNVNPGASSVYNLAGQASAPLSLMSMFGG